MKTYSVKRHDGMMVTTYSVDAASIHETAEGRWVAWAKSLSGGCGGIHIFSISREALEAKLRSGII